MRTHTLYKLITKDNEEYIFAIRSEEKPREHLKDTWAKGQVKSVKKIPFPFDRLDVSDLDTMHYIFLNGELMVDWYDDANIDYPEDLTWSRDIGKLVKQVERLKAKEIEHSLLKSRFFKKKRKKK